MSDAMTMRVGDILRLNALSMPGRTALVAAGRRYSWAEVEASANRTAHALARAGIGRGDRLAVLGYNSEAYFDLYFAAAKLGAILVPMNFWHRAPEHRYVLENSDPALVLHQTGFAAVLDEAMAGIDAPRLEFPALGEAPGPAWRDFLDGAPATPPEVEPEAEDTHIIIYTSGTTGRAKGAEIGHRRTILNALAMSGALGLKASDVFLNYFPPFHIGNWDHQKLFLIQGATVVLMAQFDAAEALAAIERERVSVILSVPTMLHALISHGDFERTDLSSVRLLYYGAYDPSGILARAADKFGAREGRIEMAHCYGLTEGGCFATLCRPEDVFAQWGSIGRAIPGVELRLAGPGGEPVADGEAGEILLRGPLMTGYWRDPAKTAETLVDGWLHTGDMAVRNAEGFLFLRDRKKDMIRSGGQNVWSKEVEDCLAAHPDVADVAVIGLDDPVYEELVCAVVVPRGAAGADPRLADSIRDFVRERKAGYNVPRRVEFLPELPKNAVGKTQKHLLRARFSAAGRDGAAPAGAAAS